MKKLAIVICLLLSAAVHAQTEINLSWTKPTTRVDGTALPVTDIAGYIIRRGVCDPTGHISMVQDTINFVGAEPPAVIGGLPTGQHCIDMMTRDTNDLQSEPSVPITINLYANPNTPGQLAACVSEPPPPPTEKWVVVGADPRPVYPKKADGTKSGTAVGSVHTGVQCSTDDFIASSPSFHSVAGQPDAVTGAPLPTKTITGATGAYAACGKVVQ